MDTQRELYDQHAESALLGAAFLDSEIFTDGVSPDDFGTPAYGLLWAACQKLARDGITPDLITLPPDVLPEGMNPIDFCNACPSAVRFAEYSGIVKYWAARRKLISAADALARAAYLDDNENRAILLGEAKDYLSSSSGQQDEIHRVTDLLTMDVEPIPDVVEGFIPGGSVTIFSGDGGIGKSYVLVEMALQIAQGLPWLGMETTKMPVLIVDLENRLRRIVLRVRSLFKGWSLHGDVDYDVSFIFESDIGLGSDGALEPLYQLVKRHGYGLVILDSLVDFLEGLDENSNAEMSAVCKRLRNIAGQTGCSILAIHHVPKGGAGTAYQSARGASALKDNTDCSLQVIRSGSGTGNMLTMRHDKARDFAYKSVKALLNWGAGTFNTTLFDSGDVVNSTSGDKDEQAIMDSLTTTEWRKRSEVIREAQRVTGSSSASFDRKMKALIETGHVLEDTMKEHGSWGNSTGVKLEAQELTS